MVARASGVVLLIFAAAAVGLGVYAYRLHSDPQKAASTGQHDAQRGQPVVVATSISKPMPRQFDTVGRAQTIASVTLRSRIDGVIEKVAVSEGQDVKAGDTLFVFDTRLLKAGLQQAQANHAKDTALLEQAKRELARLTPLAQRDFTSKSGLDLQQAAVNSLEASVHFDEATIDSMNIQLSYATISAPIDGRIGSINSKVGSSIKANDTTFLLTINQIRPIYVSFSVPQRYLPAIREGMAAGSLPVTVTAPDLANLSERGAVAYTDNAVDVTTNTLGVWATFPNEDTRLWPGLYVNVTLVFGTQQDAVVVSSEAVQAGQSSPFVFVIRPDMTAELRPVTVDRVIGGEAVIAQGLTPGETVVVDGQLRLSEGTKVTITKHSGAQAAEKIAEDQRAGPKKPGRPTEITQ
ncbi:MAG: efflux RND transporter periplasmic adaptor subunit [Rhodomicrobiaceae bacterium]